MNMIAMSTRRVKTRLKTNLKNSERMWVSLTLKTKLRLVK